MSGIKHTGIGGSSEVSRNEDGSFAVTVQVDDLHTANEIADGVRYQQRQSKRGFSKILAWDADVSPKIRATGEFIFRAMAFVGLILIGLLVAMNSGDAAILLFPNAPVPNWLLFAFGAATVPVGIWGADEIIKMIRDDIPNERQRARFFGFGFIVAAALIFDTVGVISSRIAYGDGTFDTLKALQADRQELVVQRRAATFELATLERPMVSSETLEQRVIAAEQIPTRTGRPVATVGELKEICAAEPQDYCRPYGQRFANIEFLKAEVSAARSAEERIPALEAQVAEFDARIVEIDEQLADRGGDGADITAVDEAGARMFGSDEAEFRAIRTTVISLIQVMLLAVLALLLLDDRHDQIEARRRRRAGA